MTFAECLGVIAPFYNLVLVIIVIALFLRLFKIHYNIKKKKVFTKPWRLIFFAVLVFIVEEGFTV
jgi:fumarate reductase subunit D